MESGMCLCPTYKRPYIRFSRCPSNKVMYSMCGVVQLFLFRVQLYQVRMSVRMFGPAQPQGKHQPSVSLIVV